MRSALAFVAAIALPIPAAAQSPEPASASPAAPPGEVAPSPGPASQAPGQVPPAPTPPADAPPADASPADAPPIDPAYGDAPERGRDTRAFSAPRGKDVIIVSYPDRSRGNITLLAALGGGGVLLGALGLYFHVDARSASDEVSAQSPTGNAWTADRQDTYDRAHTSSITAGVLYGVGGGLLLATAIAYIVTEPAPETMVIQPNSSRASRLGSPIIAPTAGGAVVGGAWSF